MQVHEHDYAHPWHLLQANRAGLASSIPASAAGHLGGLTSWRTWWWRCSARLRDRTGCTRAIWLSIGPAMALPFRPGHQRAIAQFAGCIENLAVMNRETDSVSCGLAYAGSESLGRRAMRPRTRGRECTARKCRRASSEHHRHDVRSKSLEHTKSSR